MRTLKQYIPYIGILALVSFVAIAVFYQSLVDEQYQRIPLKSFLANPGYYYSQAIKEVPEFNFVAVGSSFNANRIEKRCENNQCLIVLRHGDRALSEEEVQSEFVDGNRPLHVTDATTGAPVAWIIPPITANEPGEIASELGSIVWDEQRSLVIYEVFPSEELQEKRRVIVWDYTKDWSFGNIQRITLNLPGEKIEWTDYDHTNGYLQFSHVETQTGEQTRISKLSATAPILFSN